MDIRDWWKKISRNAFHEENLRIHRFRTWWEWRHCERVTDTTSNRIYGTVQKKLDGGRWQDVFRQQPKNDFKISTKWQKKFRKTSDLSMHNTGKGGGGGCHFECQFVKAVTNTYLPYLTPWSSYPLWASPIQPCCFLKIFISLIGFVIPV